MRDVDEAPVFCLPGEPGAPGDPLLGGDGAPSVVAAPGIDACALDVGGTRGEGLDDDAVGGDVADGRVAGRLAPSRLPVPPLEVEPPRDVGVTQDAPAQRPYGPVGEQASLAPSRPAHPERAQGLGGKAQGHARRAVLEDQAQLQPARVDAPALHVVALLAPEGPPARLERGPLAPPVPVEVLPPPHRPPRCPRGGKGRAGERGGRPGEAVPAAEPGPRRAVAVHDEAHEPAPGGDGELRGLLGPVAAAVRHPPPEGRAYDRPGRYARARAWGAV